MSRTCDSCFDEVDDVYGCGCDEEDLMMDTNDDELLFETIEPTWNSGPSVDDLIDELIEIGHIR